MSQSSSEGSPADVGVVIAAAGRGERVGHLEPKQFRAIAGVPMLLRALRPFARHPRVREIVVALSPEIGANPPDWLVELAGDRLRLVEGGETRAASVYRGVRALSPSCTVVLIHDAARPLVQMDIIDAVIEVVLRGTSAIAALPVSDTIKRVDESGRLVAETLDRSRLWRAQTPQGFPRETLTLTYERIDWKAEEFAPTDEAALVEAAGFPVALVCDSGINLKVTTAEDFIIAEALAHR